MSTFESRIPLGFLFLVMFGAPLWGQEAREPPDSASEAATAGGSAEDFPPNTVVARLAIDPDALAAVSTSGELIAALQEHVTLDLAMPLDEPLTVNLRGFAGDHAGSAPGYHFGFSALGLGYEGNDPLDDFPYAAAVRESHGDDFPPDGDEWSEFADDDWDEAAAWQRLVTALDIGLPQSSDAFAPPTEPGRLPLRVAVVHGFDTADWTFVESLEGALLVLQPEMSFQSLIDSSWEEPDGFGYDVRGLVIQLTPAAE